MEYSLIPGTIKSMREKASLLNRETAHDGVTACDTHVQDYMQDILLLMFLLSEGFLSLKSIMGVSEVFPRPIGVDHLHMIP